MTLTETIIELITSLCRAIFVRIYNKQRVWTAKVRKHCIVAAAVKINGRFIGMSKNISIGSFTCINENFEITGIGFVNIGQNVHIGRNCKILTVHHDYKNGYPFAESKKQYRDVVIGNDVWIGDDCVIMGGVVIGDKSVIATGTVVSKNVGVGEVVGSNTQVVIGKRECSCSGRW